MGRERAVETSCSCGKAVTGRGGCRLTPAESIHLQSVVDLIVACPNVGARRVNPDPRLRKTRWRQETQRQRCPSRASYLHCPPFLCILNIHAPRNSA